MNFLEYKECIVIAWDCVRKVRCLKLKSGREGRLFVKGGVSADGGENLTAAMLEVLRKIRPQEHQLVILTGPIPGTVCAEFMVPQLSESDILPAAQYELSRFLPCGADDIVTGFRVIPSEGQPQGKMRVRTCSVLLKEWLELVSDIRNSGIKVDAIVHPFMAVDPLFGDLGVLYLKDVEPGFAYSLGEADSSRRVLRAELFPELDSHAASLKTKLQEIYTYDSEAFPSGELFDEYLTPLLVGAYGLSHEFDKDRSFLLPLPKELLPERFRGLRILFLLLTVIGAGLLLGIWGRNLWENHQRLLAIEKERKLVEQRILELKKDNISNKKFDEIIGKIKEVEPELGNHEIIYCLHELNRIVPMDMWMTNFNARRDAVEATFSGGADSKEEIDFKRSKMFAKPEINKRRNPDGSVNVYVRLHYMSPAERFEALKAGVREEPEEEAVPAAKKAAAGDNAAAAAEKKPTEEQSKQTQDAKPRPAAEKPPESKPKPVEKPPEKPSAEKPKDAAEHKKPEEKDKKPEAKEEEAAEEEAAEDEGAEEAEGDQGENAEGEDAE